MKKIYTQNGSDIVMDSIDRQFSRRKIYIVGEITNEMAAEICASVRSLAVESEDDITMYIMSPGGSISAGLTIYDTIKAIKCDVRTVACGMPASMGAFLVACAGTKGKRYIQENAEMLIHQPSGGVKGQASDIIIHARHISRLKVRINNLMARATGQPVEKIKADTDRDYILSAREAVKYGLADIIGEPEI